ncbi:MAG: gliding motility-associated C-terminal domain-containing protein [Flavobacteriales bacterium]
MKELVNSHPSIFRGLAASCLRVLSIAFTLALVTGSASAQMTGVTWEVDTAFYEPTTFDAAGEPLYADLEGYVTYKLFAEFTNPTDELSSIFASDVPSLSTLPLYIDAPCGCFNPTLGDVLLGADQNPAFFVVLPEVQYDSYWSLGNPAGTASEQSIFDNPNYNSLTMCSEQVAEGSIFTLSPIAAGDDLRIQFAQVTTCGSFEFHACFSVFVNGNQSQNEFWCMGDFVNDGEDLDGDGPSFVPNPCEIYAQTNAAIDITSSIDCFGDLASVDVNAYGVSPITYELFDASDSTLVTTQIDDNEFSGLTEGDYFVAIVDGNTCRDSSDVFGFVEPPELSATWSLLEDNTCPGDLSSVVEIDFSGGVPNYDIVAFSATNTGQGLLPDPNYQWVGLDCVDGNGEWDFEITDANGCSLDTSITISCIDPLVLQATAEDITCFSYGDGLIEGSMSGGTGTLTLTGSPNLGANISGEGSVDFAVTDLQAAEYFLLVTDANGCQDSTEVTIIEPDSVTMQIIANDLLCAESCDGEVNIAAFGGSGVFDYSVTDEDGNEYDDEGLCVGSYLANAVDENGCVVDSAFQVMAPDSILFDIVIEDVTCNGEANGSICVENATGGTGALSFQVDPPGAAFQFDPCFDVASGTYVVTAMDEAGCEVSSDPQLVIEPDAIQLILSATEITCTSYADGILTVEGIGGTGALTLVEPEDGALPYTLEDLPPGPIGVTVEDENGCLSTEAAEIIEPDSLQVEWLLLEDVGCGGDCDGTAIVDFSGGTGSVMMTLNGSEEFNFAALCAGPYTATVVDANGCTDSTLFEIMEPDPIEVLIDVTDVTCTGMNDGEVNIFPIGGTGDITWEVLEEGLDLLNLYEGVYTITAIDSIGCVEDTAFTVAAEVDTDMLINMLSSPVTCWNEQDGTATASVVGGFQPIEYLWSDEDAQTTATATGLYEDTYSVVVTDSLGCTLTRVVTVEPTIGCFFIAEAITPNGDGYNDEWIVGGLEYFPAAEVRVFNRWGQQVFYSQGYQERWDGRYNNAPLPMADYYYVIEFAGDKDPITGTVTLKY